RVFERGGGDILSAGCDEDLLLAARDRQEAFGIERSDVARPEPAALAERLCGRLRVVPVLLEDVDAAHLDLAVVAQADADTGKRRTDRADLRLVGEVHRGGSGRLGESVALQDHDA